MAEVCREFGLSRTGYKILNRYNDCGVPGGDRPFAPSLSIDQSPARADRGADCTADCTAEAGQAELGRAEDPRTNGQLHP